MNIFLVLLIIIGSVIILGILFFLFVVWGFPKGFRNKFGPEWIPAELRINFNHFNVSNENKKTIRYALDENETDEIFIQIYSLITNNTQAVNNSFPFKFPESFWIKIDHETYEYRQIETNKLKAIFSTKNKELIYHK
jgi:hypothetical protein